MQNAQDDENKMFSDDLRVVWLYQQRIKIVEVYYQTKKYEG